MANSGECQDYPWFQDTLLPFRYRFCENYERLMERVGREVVDTTPRVRRAWDVPLRFRGDEVVLKVYEESVNFASPNCEQCRCNGWQHHPVCTKKIHFIIPSPTKHVADVEMFDSKLHVLHGMVHVNGFGHLMRINGREGGSGKLRGEEVMKMWDALCRCLRVRDVTVEDVSNKKGMLLRVLLPIAHRSTFYMRHGYKFGRGQFNVKETQWTEAVEKLNGTLLDDVMLDFDGVDETTQRIILRYDRDGEIRTLGGLMEYMLWLTEREDRSLQFAMDECGRTENVEEAMRKLKAKLPEEIQPQPQPTTNGICSTDNESNTEGDSEAMEIEPPTDTNPTPASQPASQRCSQPASPGTDRSGSDFDVPMSSDRSEKKRKKVLIADDPGDLQKPKMVPFNAAALFEGSRKYSATKMVEIIRISLGVLQELRDILYDTAHDKVLADFVLGKMANTVVNGFSIIKSLHTFVFVGNSIFRQRSKLARCYYCLFEKYVPVEETSVVMKESFLSQVEEPALPAPGPEVVNGQSLEHFESYLGLLFKWMCHQPHVAIGRGPNKNRPKSKRKEPGSEIKGCLNSSGSVRITRSALSNASKRSKVDPPRPKMEPWMEVYPSEVAPHLELMRTSGPRPGVPVTMKQSILADLLYLYQSILEGYKPMMKGHAKIRLSDVPKHVLILKDSKFFVKRFQPDPVPGRMERNGEPGLLRLVCQCRRLKDDQPLFFRQPPPPEEVFVPMGASMVQVRKSVEDAFSKIYAMFDLWSVGTMSNLTLDNSCLDAPSDRIIEVKGHGFRPELELRHSGGIEDWEVLCSCGTRDDDGARMLCCDGCSVWMHTRCVGFRDDVNVPSYFHCHHCPRNNHLNLSS